MPPVRLVALAALQAAAGVDQQGVGVSDLEGGHVGQAEGIGGDGAPQVSRWQRQAP